MKTLFNDKVIQIVFYYTKYSDEFICLECEIEAVHDTDNFLPEHQVYSFPKDDYLGNKKRRFLFLGCYD